MKTLMAPAVLAATFLAQPAHAEIVTYEFTGVISGLATMYEGQSTAYQSFEFEGRQFTVGQTYTGVLRYLTDAKVTYDDPSFNSYAGPATLSFNFPASGLALTNGAGSEHFSVSNGPPPNGDSFLFIAQAGPYSLQLGLGDGTGATFTDDSVPATLSLADFISATTSVSAPHPISAVGHNIYGRLTSLTKVSPVPEPDAVWLLLGGLGILGARRYARGR